MTPIINRIFRFRLRTLFVGIALLSAALAILAARVHDARRQRDFVDALLAKGMTVQFHNKAIPWWSQGWLDTELLVRIQAIHGPLDRLLAMQIPNCTQIVQLTLENSTLTDDDLDPIVTSSVQVLDLRQTQITDVGLKKLSQMSNVTTLYLSSATTDVGLSYLVDLKSLVTLYCTSTAVRGPGFMSLSRVPSLRSLLVSLPRLTDDDLRYFEGLEQLEYLVIAQSKLTTKGYKHIHDKLPHCRIKR